MIGIKMRYWMILLIPVHVDHDPIERADDMQGREYGYVYTGTAWAAGKAEPVMVVSDQGGDRVSRDISGHLDALNFLGAQGWIISESSHWGPDGTQRLYNIVKREKPGNAKCSVACFKFHAETTILRLPPRTDPCQPRDRTRRKPETLTSTRTTTKPALTSVAAVEVRPGIDMVRRRSPAWGVACPKQALTRW